MDKTLREEPEFYISDTGGEVDESDFDSRPRRRRRAGDEVTKVKKSVPFDFSKLRRVVVGVSLVCGLGALGYGGWIVQRHHSQWCPIKEVRIEGAFIYLERDQFAQQIESIAHGGFFEVDLDGIKEAAAKLPWVDSIVIRRVWPDTLVIEVTEKRALARWKNSNLISDRGEIFTPLAESFPPGLVHLTGPEGSKTKVYKALQKLEVSAKRLATKISEVTLDARGSWQVGLADGVMVTLGKESVFARFEKFVTMYERVCAAREAPVKTVDMRYRNGFAVAFEPNSDSVSLRGAQSW